MAQAHHALHRRQTSTTSSLTERPTRKYPLSPLSKRRATTYGIARISSTRSQDSVASTSSSEAPRSVLGPLQANLRRRPSRLRLSDNRANRRGTHSAVSELEDEMSVGNKRKRSTSGNENMSAGRLGGSARRMKRQRSETSSRFGSDDETEQGSLMDVDEPPRQAFPSPDDSVHDFDSSDEYWLHEAHNRELSRLRKDELVRLYQAAGLTDDADALTKNMIVQAIVESREDSVTLPPSSPPGRSNASDCSSDDDDGNTAEDESTFRPSPREVLGRRTTVAIFGGSASGPQHIKSRSASMYLPTLEPTSQDPTSRRPHAQPSAKACPSRRRTTSMQDGGHPSFLPSPPITRQRSRVPSVASDLSIGKGKGKRVEFAEALPMTPRKRSRPPGSNGSDLSDLTDIPDEEEGEDANTEATPRPKVRSSADGANRRKTPARKAKTNVGSLREESDISTDEELTQSVALSTTSRSPTPPSPTMPLGRKTPLKNRLRPRQGTQTHTPPSDGDDEDEEVEDLDEAEDGDTEADPDSIAITPKRLRSGKVLGDGSSVSPDASDEDEPTREDEDIVEDVDETVDDAATVEGDDDEVEELVEEDVENGELDDGEDVDLFVASIKTLTRLRRDELVRMCETRGIDVEGTKLQLAEALLGWRDQQASAPSSTGTAHPPSRSRPPSTAKPLARTRRKSSRSSGQKTPILLRSHVHVEQPHTPPVSAPATVREIKESEDGEPELDLASLGLDDREIPCEKLTKLEKIGSGGFKDVFIGKLKNRKIAIAEFRGQLTAMDIKELKLLGEFDHPNIVRFLGVSIPENTKETPVMVVSELCANGDLFDYVRNVQPPRLVKVLTLMLDIAKGLEYLHLRKPSVIHRDCKSSNILITSRVTAKIADFGLAKVKQSTRSMVRSLVGTVNWQAPELWSPHPKYNHKVDVFSCAMVFWEMLQWHLAEKKYPWEGMNEHAIYDIVGAKRQRPSVSGLKKQWCPEVVELMERMWAHEHQDRPTMSEVVQELQDLVQQYR